MQVKEAVPKDASAVILVRENSTEVYLAQRNPKISFLGGYHAFPGGKIDPEDATLDVRNCADGELKKFIACAVRETFEEIGVLLVRGGDKITRGQRASLRNDLVGGIFTFAEILQNWGLWIDADDFRYVGFWTTPKFSPVRFKTRFFVAVCPRKQEPQTFGEFVSGEFTEPEAALSLWEKSEILISPPVLITLQILAGDKTQRRRDAEAEEKESGENGDEKSGKAVSLSRSVSSPVPLSSASLRLCVENLLSASKATGGTIRFIKFNPFITCFPVHTETLPPATHTNCFIAGEKEFVVIDPGSPFADEQQALHAHLDALIESGAVLREIILTHLHRDHVSGAAALQKHLKKKFDLNVSIAAAIETAESLGDDIRVERFIRDNETIELATTGGEKFELTALHTPGHARGHLCFYDARRGFLLSGDMVVGTGSVLIAPPEGNMQHYLAALDRLKDLPHLRFLCGSHGAAIFDARGKIENYIAHRLEREKKILEAVRAGARSPREIVERAYEDVSEDLWDLAEKSVEAHLEKLRAEGKLEAEPK